MPTPIYSEYVHNSGGGNGVSSLNSITGAVTLVAGTGITVVPAGSVLTISATGGAGANTALSNLASVAINTTLLPVSNGTTIDLGSPTLRFRDGYMKTISSNNGLVFDIGGYLLVNSSVTAIDFSTATNVLVNYTASNPSYWSGTPPTTMNEAIDRIAAVVSFGGGSPIP